MKTFEIWTCLAVGLLTSCAPSYVNGNSSSSAVNQSASSGPLTLSASSLTVAEAGYLQLTASGGTSPYTYEVVSGSGTIDSTGLYFAPNTAGNIEIGVMDSAGAFASTWITVSNTGSSSSSATLSLNTTSVSVAASSAYAASTYQFTATGGVSPYTYYVISPTSPTGGIMNSSSGVYTAPTMSGQTVTVGVEDSAGKWAYAQVSITSAVVKSTNLCSDNWGCASTLGLTRELDGGEFQTAASIAYHACVLKGYSNVYQYSVEYHSISCGKNYGIEDWTGSAFYDNEAALCGNGYVVVISSIDCVTN